MNFYKYEALDWPTSTLRNHEGFPFQGCTKWLWTLHSAIVLNRRSLPVFHPYDRAQLHTRKGSRLNHRLSPPWQFPELLQHRCVVRPEAKLIAGL
jgi:hypothetical protein